MKRSLIEVELELANTNALLELSLKYFGDQMAKKMKYKSLKGFDVIHFYLIDKYHWQTGYVRSLSSEELRFLLSEEMHGFVLPDQVAKAISSLRKDS